MPDNWDLAVVETACYSRLKCRKISRTQLVKDKSRPRMLYCQQIAVLKLVGLECDSASVLWPVTCPINGTWQRSNYLTLRAKILCHAIISVMFCLWDWNLLPAFCWNFFLKFNILKYFTRKTYLFVFNSADLNSRSSQVWDYMGWPGTSHRTSVLTSYGAHRGESQSKPNLLRFQKVILESG